MLFAPDGEVFVAKLQVTGPSANAPPGTYISLGLGSGNDSTRVLLRPAQALALGRWLRRPKAKNIADRVQSPTSFPVVAIDPKPSCSSASATAAVSPITEDESVATLSPSGDHLVSARFISGLRERLGGSSTAELERELGTFEPYLTGMAKRLIRGVVAGHLGADAPCADDLAEACYRETLVLLLAFRGASSDLWCGIYGSERGRGGSPCSP